MPASTSLLTHLLLAVCVHLGSVVLPKQLGIEKVHADSLHVSLICIKEATLKQRYTVQHAYAHVHSRPQKDGEGGREGGGLGRRKRGLVCVAETEMCFTRELLTLVCRAMVRVFVM